VSEISERRRYKKKKRPIKPITPNEGILPIESDEYLAFIAGYTSGGCAYGLTHDQFKPDDKDLKNTNT
jgi:hypothetical protein